MIGNPVESCRAEYAIKGVPEREILQIGCNKLSPGAEPRAQVIAGRCDHVLGYVDADNPAFGQVLQQLGCQTAATAARVHEKFIATEFQRREDLLAPTKLRSGETVIGCGIPLAGLR